MSAKEVQYPSVQAPPRVSAFFDATSVQVFTLKRAQQPNSNTFLQFIPLTWVENISAQVSKRVSAQQPDSYVYPLIPNFQPENTLVQIWPVRKIQQPSPESAPTLTPLIWFENIPGEIRLRKIYSQPDSYTVPVFISVPIVDSNINQIFPRIRGQSSEAFVSPIFVPPTIISIWFEGMPSQVDKRISTQQPNHLTEPVMVIPNIIVAGGRRRGGIF